MSPQQTIAHYRITAKLGEGGMGEVWRATDTKLNRDVAIKILPAAFSTDPDRMARFTREAQVLASLNHPNIAAIYGVEDRALIMELVEGDTLPTGLPIETALNYARQIADALEYAHERGIIHRDLKPANIKVTPDGRVKVLDFGLAKAMTVDVEPGNPASSPTLTMRSTVVGALMGTAAYMSPEQARGQNLDKRADIWAFGVVLYEMVTGRQLFEGPTISDTLAAVLTRQPDFENVPARLRRLLRQCLQPDPRLRLRDIGDARVLIDETNEPPTPPPSRRSLVPWICAAVLALAVAVTGVGWWRATLPPDRPMVRFNVELGPDAIAADRIPALVSPDGTRLVYSVRNNSGGLQLATRVLDQVRPTVLSGTEGGEDPFFSPDGQWIGFFAGGKMKKISVQGGAAYALCDAQNSRGAAWSESGDIIVNPDLLNLFRVPAGGGAPQMVSQPAKRGERTNRWPQMLPGDESVLFTASNTAGGLGYEESNLEVLSLKTGEAKIVQRGGYFGRYLPSGHLIYVHQGAIFGVPFDLSRLETRGVPVPLLGDIAANVTQGSGRFDFSRNGTFVYVSGTSAVTLAPLVWMDSAGNTQPIVTTPTQAQTPRLSPDGKRLALSIQGDLFVYDISRDAMTKLTFDRNLNRFPVWTPDGQHIVFSSGVAGPATDRVLYIRADGSGEQQVLLESKSVHVPYSISPDGRHLAMTDLGGGHTAIWTVPLDLSLPDRPKTGKPSLYLKDPTDVMDASFSPDGRWMAYVSLESGNYQVFVRPFPIETSSGKWQISTNSGRRPVWSRNGRELFFVTTDNRIWVAGYTSKEGSFIPEKPRLWTQSPIFNFALSYTWNFDLAPDGKRVVVFPDQGNQQKGPVHVTVLLNFFDEVRRKLPVK
jgi:serine/threonine-protein kinase